MSFHVSYHMTWLVDSERISAWALNLTLELYDNIYKEFTLIYIRSLLPRIIYFPYLPYYLPLRLVLWALFQGNVLGAATMKVAGRGVEEGEAASLVGEGLLDGAFRGYPHGGPEEDEAAIRVVEGLRLERAGGYPRGTERRTTFV